jgi:hypothetical protein
MKLKFNTSDMLNVLFPSYKGDERSELKWEISSHSFCSFRVSKRKYDAIKFITYYGNESIEILTSLSIDGGWLTVSGKSNFDYGNTNYQYVKNGSLVIIHRIDGMIQSEQNISYTGSIQKKKLLYRKILNVIDVLSQTQMRMAI